MMQTKTSPRPVHVNFLSFISDNVLAPKTTTTTTTTTTTARTAGNVTDVVDQLRVMFESRGQHMDNYVACVRRQSEVAHILIGTRHISTNSRRKSRL